MSILNKLVVIVVVAAVVSVAVFYAVLYPAAAGVLREMVARPQQESARHLMSRIDEGLNDAALDVQAIADTPPVAAWLSSPAVDGARPPASIAGVIQDFEYTTGPWENIKIVDNDGRVWFSNRRAEIGSPVRTPEEQQAIAQALRSRSYVATRVTLSSEYGRPTIVFIAPIFAEPPEARTLGVVIGYYGWPAVVEILDSSRSRVRLLDETGLVIAAQSDTRRSMLRERIDRPEVRRAAAAQRESQFTWKRDGESLLVNYVPQRGALSFPARGWGLLQESPLSAVYAPLQKLAWQVGAATLGAFALFTLVITWMSRRLTRPIARLTEAAQRVSAGDLSVRSDIRGRDELGVLAKSFNVMLESLHEEIEGRRAAEMVVEAERSALAQRVAERTAELQRVNTQLSEAAKVKDEFLANMSHELRTPLNAILGLSEALLDGSYGAIDDDKRAAIRTIEESGAHLLSLINDVLDVAKIEAGMLELEREPVAIDALCHSSVVLLREAAQRKGIALHYGGCKGENCIVIGDFRRLKQVLVNLLSNAVKFTRAGGGVTLAVQFGGGVVRLSVADTGIGIAAADLDRLFRPFVQVDSSLSRSHEGTGLGLTLVGKLVDLHGGSVSVESEPGKGSRFTVTLPAGGTLAADDRDASEAAVRLDGMRVLVVDDNDANAQMVARYLTSQGAEIGVARDGAEAVVMAAAQQWNAVLMDIQMPRMDGLAATRTIREAGGAMPIIATTSFAMPNDRRRALDAGMNDYMAKPLRLRQLTRLIAELTEQHA